MAMSNLEKIVTDGLVQIEKLAEELDLKKVIRFALANGFSTGHAKTLDDLLEELTWQIKELRSKK
jgi:hypothetical protein